VWEQLKSFLNDRDDIINNHLEKKRRDKDQLHIFEEELKRIECQIKGVDREQQQLLQWALKGFPENQIEAENKRLNKARETLKAQKIEYEKRLKACKEAVVNVPKMEEFLRNIQGKLPFLDYDGKRLALYFFNITVCFYVKIVEATGIIDPGIMLTPSLAATPFFQ
jgi:DNA segregation ATPase FtsK/SpoIIIE-like protein